MLMGYDKNPQKLTRYRLILNDETPIGIARKWAIEKDDLRESTNLEQLSHSDTNLNSQKNCSLIKIIFIITNIHNMCTYTKT